MATRRKAPSPRADTMPARVAVLEAQVAAHETSDAEHFAELRGAFARIDQRLTAIEEKLTRQKGFLGGVVFVVSAVWGVIVLFVKSKLGVN